MIVGCPRCQLRYDVTGRPPGTRARCRCGHEFLLPRPGADAATLGCPECGAPSAPDKTRCEFCQATLAKVRCPRCFGLLFQGFRHCRHCGARVDTPARAAPDEEGDAPRECPRCVRGGGGALVAVLAGEVLLDHCPGCGGLWIDQECFERVVANREQQFGALLALGRRPASPVREGGAAQVSYLPCPDCKTLMARRNYGETSGVIIDLCHAHGIWFDADELPQIIEFVSRGGLEESRRREVQRLKDEALRARHEARHAESTGSRAGFFTDDRLLGRRGGGLAGLVNGLARLLLP